MGQPHKHRDLIRAWADGAEIEFYSHYNEAWFQLDDIRNLVKFDSIEYRIKPPQWQEDLRQAVRNGKTIEIKHGDWMWSSINENVDTYLFGVFTEDRYRIKPEPKPDLVRYIKLNPEELDYISGDLRWRVQQGVFCYSSKQNKDDNLRLIIDGETGKLKDAEVLK